MPTLQHKAGLDNKNASVLIPKNMSVEQLKNALCERGMSPSGRKDLLIRRLEGVLSASS